LFAGCSAAATLFLTCLGWSWATGPQNAGVKFELRRAESKPAQDLTEATVAGTKTKVYLHRETAISNQDIAQAEATTDDTNKPAVSITFTEDGWKKMAKLMGEHQGKLLAILLDGKVIAAPIVRDPVTGNKAMISGHFTKAEAERIAKGIQGQ